MKVLCRRAPADSVELLMMIEDCFNIVMPDSDAEQIETVGDLYDYVRERVPEGSSDKCLTPRAFYAVRRSLMRLTGCSRKDIQPDTSLHELFPRESRQERWAGFWADLGMSGPGLRPPEPTATRVYASAGLMILCGLTGIIMAIASGAYFWLLLTLALPMCWILLRVMRPRLEPIELPDCDCDDVGDLARMLLVKSGALREALRDGASDSQLWGAIVNVLVLAFGMKPSQVTRELRFGSDLLIGENLWPSF